MKNHFGEEERDTEKMVQMLGETVDRLCTIKRLVANAPCKADYESALKHQAIAAGVFARTYHNLLRSEFDRMIHEINCATADAIADSGREVANEKRRRSH